MATTKPTLTIAPTDRVLSLITRSFPSLESHITTVQDAASSTSTLTLSDASTISGTNTIASYLAPHIFPATTYTPLETAQINQWLSLTSPPSLTTALLEINENFKDKTTLIGSKLSIADIIAYARITPVATTWSADERTGGATGGYRYLLRWIDYIQNTPELNLSTDKIEIDLNDVRTTVRAEEAKKEVKSSKGKGKEDSPAEVLGKVKAAVEGVKEQIAVAGKGIMPEGAQTKKKEKAPKAPKAPAVKKEERAIDPSLIDLRVGFIEQCIPHSNADSLFVSTIQCGDPEGPRTVCSGLNGLIPIEEMQKRYVVVVCNLKPVTMRGVKSAAMVLAASPRLKEGEVDDHKGPVELVTPPEGSKAGEKVYFEGYEQEAEGMLNPKKKVWEGVQPGFTTTEGLVVAFDAAAEGVAGAGASTSASTGVRKLVTSGGGVCTVGSLVGAVVR